MVESLGFLFWSLFPEDCLKTKANNTLGSTSSYHICIPGGDNHLICVKIKKCGFMQLKRMQLGGNNYVQSRDQGCKLVYLGYLIMTSSINESGQWPLSAAHRICWYVVSLHNLVLLLFFTSGLSPQVKGPFFWLLDWQIFLFPYTHTMAQ